MQYSQLLITTRYVADEDTFSQR